MRSVNFFPGLPIRWITPFSWFPPTIVKYWHALPSLVVALFFFSPSRIPLIARKESTAKCLFQFCKSALKMFIAIGL
ncbi:hypothetical protein M434DRAFT_335182 [Hypoxylon sp. CO27-5]|nr:hypothetical protein M434DRAFT_335182 [Hypoxylon sp. CO27-5]